MEGIIILVLLLVVLCIAIPIMALSKAISASNRIDVLHKSIMELDRRCNRLETELFELKKPDFGGANEGPRSEIQSLAKGAPAPSKTVVAACPVLPPVPASPPPKPADIPPLIPAAKGLRPAPSSIPPGRETPAAGIRPPQVPATPRAAINWEQFLGVKLFAWVGAIALFLGVGFLVKYGFEQGWISPQVRVGMGLVIGLGLLAGGLAMSREKYAPTVQAVCSSGILILYADIFAACMFYHFLPESAAFLLMTAVTGTAFILAVKLDAQAVAILALLGGFLTPPLLSTGRDNPVGLFGYLAILDLGLIAVAFRKRWNYLVLLGAIATIIMQAGWVNKFFEAPKVETAMIIFLGFAWFFVLALVWAHRAGNVEKFVSAAAIAMPCSALVFALSLMVDSRTAITSQPGLLFSYIFAADLALLVIAWRRAELRGIHTASGGAVFLLLAIWTFHHLTPGLLNWALGFYFGFALLHTAFPCALERLCPSADRRRWPPVFAPLGLLLAMVPLFKLDELTMAIWPVVLLIDVVAIAAAFLTACATGIVVTLAVTVLATAFWIGLMPAEGTLFHETLILIGGFALLFFGAGILAVRRRLGVVTVGGKSGAGLDMSISDAALLLHIPAMSAIPPFLLLVMVLLRLHLPDPSLVFGLGALMLLLVLALVRWGQTNQLCAIGLACILALEYNWYFRSFSTTQAAVPLVWYLGFYAVFMLFPFVLKGPRTILPWAVAAAAGPAHFLLVYKLVQAAYPNAWMGLIPAAFVLPSFAVLQFLARSERADAPRRNALLALFGGLTLFFVTLIFPIQFERQWITISWALEGAALLWLYHRVPHEGLRWAGVGLLCTAFVRLALNPAAYQYYERTGTPILNWFLYAYGLVILSLFVSARLLAPPHNRLGDFNLPPILRSLGVVLAFFLMNIDIADCFSKGTVIEFQFSGSFARDMAYSLGWAVFAFVLLAAGIQSQSRAARYAGMGLLSATLVKLFLHDLWSLGGLYRVGSLIGLALVLFPVSLLYQRFLAKDRKAGGE
jgi:hypothetical protein